MTSFTALLLLAFVRYITCSPLPADPSSLEPISLFQSDAEDPTLPDMGNPTCPLLSSMLQNTTQHTRRDTSRTRLLRRGRSITPFGTIFETIPAEVENSRSHIVRLTYGTGLDSETSAQITIVDSADMMQHVIPGWQMLFGGPADLTIMQGMAELDKPQLSNHAHLVRAFSNEAWRLILQSNEPIQKDFPGFSIMNRLFTAATWGSWIIKVAAFPGVPGYSYAIQRITGQPKLSSDQHRAGPKDKKAMGLAACILAASLADLVRSQLEQTRIDIDRIDAIYIMILLQVINQLSHEGLKAITSTMPESHADGHDLIMAVALLGSGRIGSKGDPSETMSLHNQKGFSQRLGTLPECNAYPATPASSSAQDKVIKVS